jgi:hypothetical protein
LKKITSINSISDFHKEKEMVDFRKWLLAFAATALLFGLGTSAYAQGTTAFVCQATAGNPNIVRAEGVTELVGDLVLNCTGGTYTAVGVPIPLSTVQISLNTNVTSRLTGSGAGDFATEAILAVDEPFPVAPVFPATATPVNGAGTQLGCVADGQHNCEIAGAGVASNFGASGPYSGAPGHYNVFQGIANGGPNQINWQGVPIDAPGTAGTRILRITNIRANASQLSPGSSLVPTTITELIGINGGETIIIDQPLQTVALIEKGLIGTASTSVLYAQCNNLNAFLLNGTGGLGTAASPVSFTLTATEGFGAAFKRAVFSESVNSTNTAGQNVLGASYNTESGYIPSGVTGLDQTGRVIGLADTGTEVTFTISGIPSGVQVFAPVQVLLVGPGGTALVTTDGTNTPEWTLPTTAQQGGYSYANLVTGATTTNDLNPPSASTSAFAQVPVSGTSASVTYEVEGDNPSIVESMIVPIEASYITSSSTVPLPGTVSSSINFSPLAGSTQQGEASGPIPRFVQPYGPASAFTINPCTCNLLFPFVTNIAGFDTGVAIANTSQDPFNTPVQTGVVNLYYYGTTSGGGAAPPTATSSAVAGGQELIFTLSNGGNFGVPATPGFEGYIIAQADFQYCHGFAFISDVGAQKLAEGYLAISLDLALLNRTGNAGENEGH